MSLKDRFEKRLLKQGVLEESPTSSEPDAAAPPQSLELAVNNDRSDTTENPELAGEDSPQAYGIYRSPGAHPSVKVHLANGRAHHIFYARLQEIVTDGEELILLFCSTGYIMSIEGKKLTPLANLLGRHKVLFIKENARGEQGLMVGKITIEFMNDTLKTLLGRSAP